MPNVDIVKCIHKIDHKKLNLDQLADVLLSRFSTASSSWFGDAPVADVETGAGWLALEAP